MIGMICGFENLAYCVACSPRVERRQVLLQVTRCPLRGALSGCMHLEAEAVKEMPDAFDARTLTAFGRAREFDKERPFEILGPHRYEDFLRPCMQGGVGFEL